MPLRVYLDSSDYSVLSDPQRMSREAPGVLEVLRGLRDAGSVEFFFSAAHITEMAPLQQGYADAGVRRASVLAELCGGNCLVHHEILFEAEVKIALGLSQFVFDPIDRCGKWFPDGSAEMSPVTAADQLLSVKTTIAEVLLTASRAQKRQTQRKIAKSGKLRPAFRDMLRRNAGEGDLTEILALYPMRPDAARVLAQYSVGVATAGEATTAFESSLRDPRWMMQWFEKHYDKLTPFVAWARGPAGELTEKVLELSKLIESARANPLITGEELTSMYSPAKWEEWQANMLEGIANRFADKLKPGAKLGVANIDKDCPGISIAIRSLHSAWRSITFEKPRKPKASDFVDALHAAYAPYVDVFRADGFMADHVAKQVAGFRTKVVPKLSSLPEVLRQRLAVM